MMSALRSKFGEKRSRRQRDRSIYNRVPGQEAGILFSRPERLDMSDTYARERSADSDADL